jgi:hypothetical protein
MYGNDRQETNMRERRTSQQPIQTQSNATLSNNELDYKSYILYVIPGDKSSQQAQRMAAKFNDIQISNIFTIPPAKRPKWLNGAPILVNVQKNQAHRGSKALEELQKINQEFLGASRRPGIGFDATISYEETTSSNPTRSSHSGCSIVPMLDDESKYTNGKKLKESDITLYADRRAKEGRSE